MEKTDVFNESNREDISEDRTNLSNKEVVIPEKSMFEFIMKIREIYIESRLYIEIPKDIQLSSLFNKCCPSEQLEISRIVACICKYNNKEQLKDCFRKVFYCLKDKIVFTKEAVSTVLSCYDNIERIDEYHTNIFEEEDEFSNYINSVNNVSEEQFQECLSRMTTLTLEDKFNKYVDFMSELNISFLGEILDKSTIQEALFAMITEYTGCEIKLPKTVNVCVYKEYLEKFNDSLDEFKFKESDDINFYMKTIDRIA